MIKAADMMIARRADTRARADFATWKMMAKLNGASSLPTEAQTFLAGYQELLKEMTRPGNGRHHPSRLRSYYAEMGGVGEPPDVKAHPVGQVTDNVTAFKRPPPSGPGMRVVRTQSRGFPWP